jgi:hypothetical protein
VISDLYLVSPLVAAIITFAAAQKRRNARGVIQQKFVFHKISQIT